MTKGREALVQEKDKLKYAIEKSRQIDIEIEKKRRETYRSNHCSVFCRFKK